MKKTALEKAIEQLQFEIHILELAIGRLRQQQTTKAQRKPRLTPEVVEKQSAQA